MRPIGNGADHPGAGSGEALVNAPARKVESWSSRCLVIRFLSSERLRFEFARDSNLLLEPPNGHIDFSDFLLPWQRNRRSPLRALCK